jgi:excisionase family DNA binding protein
MDPSSRQNTSDQGARSRYRPTPATPDGGPSNPTSVTPTSEEAPTWPPKRPHGGQQAHPPCHPADSGRPVDGGNSLDQLPHVLTVREVAAILRVGRNQLYEAVARGELPAVRIGRTIRISTTALKKLLAAPSHRPGGGASPR